MTTPIYPSYAQWSGQKAHTLSQISDIPRKAKQANPHNLNDYHPYARLFRTTLLAYKYGDSYNFFHDDALRVKHRTCIRTTEGRRGYTPFIEYVPQGNDNIPTISLPASTFKATSELLASKGTAVVVFNNHLFTTPSPVPQLR